MRRCLALILATLLCSCGSDVRPPSAPTSQIGRYQMQPGPHNGVYVLDTDEGWLKLCSLDENGATLSCSNDVGGK